MPIWAICTSRQNQNSLAKIKGCHYNLCPDIFLSRLLHRLEFQSCQISSAFDLLMRSTGIVSRWTQTPVARIHRTSFHSFKILEFRNKKKVNAFLINFSQFNNKLVAAVTTNGVEHSVSFHCVTFPWMLKDTFSTFPLSFQAFRCLEHTNNCFIFSKSGLKYPQPLRCGQ